MELSEPYESDGKLIRSILSRHSDGFVCLRFEDVEPSKERAEKTPRPEGSSLTYPEGAFCGI